ncbi:hypothetical protein TSUD_247970 [Trifolium subterraneum]|uniref:non-specific serine/threonine protein kinase n=1 Tax=Trifolium subterraneum TaxID=3900 RepID=A0A2Z6NGW1_TRISU|nr:hypothetical protein TSUD_247970 [Trifolium subterraneum]
MKTNSLSSVVFSTFTVVILLFSTPFCNALGSGTTLAVVDSTGTVCGVVSAEKTQNIVCYRHGKIISAEPEVSFSSISGGKNYFCGIRSGNYSILCWDTVSSNTTFEKRRLYNNGTVLYENLAVGDSHVCATVVGVGTVSCWRINKGFILSSGYDQFSSITSGFGFSCGILKKNISGSVRCFGNVDESSIAEKIEKEFMNISMVSLVAGESHVCGLNSKGFLVCKGSNNFGQINVPNQVKPLEYSDLALGSEHSCAIRRSNGSVVCWGGKGLFNVNVTKSVSFESIVSGSNFTCGLTTNNFSVICWGPGWFDNGGSVFEIPLPPILPGICVQSSCGECGIYPQSQFLCSGFGNICKPKPCWPQLEERQSSRIMKRQRSGTSSTKHPDRSEDFALAELVAATNNFSRENKIGAGSYGIVYKGKLTDGREVAIKRGETSTKMKVFQEKESAFESELAFLSRLHHKHLVRLVGFCDEKDERLLVYEFMKNGALYDHLHDKNNIDKDMPIIMKGELMKILDQRVEKPEMNETEAVELVAYTAMHCVHLEGKDRPTISDIVANLERAFTLCDSSSHGSISSATISIGSD